MKLTEILNRVSLDYSIASDNRFIVKSYDKFELSIKINNNLAENVINNIHNYIEDYILFDTKDTLLEDYGIITSLNYDDLLHGMSYFPDRFIDVINLVKVLKNPSTLDTSDIIERGKNEA